MGDLRFLKTLVFLSSNTFSLAEELTTGVHGNRGGSQVYFTKLPQIAAA
jgi:hypothetical protein